MRYAIPVSGGTMSSHFGHCEQFALIDVEDQNKTISAKELIPSPEHQPGLLPGWLAEKGVSIVIAGGMGPMAQDIFRQNGVEVVLGVMENDPEKAVQSYLDGRLDIGDNICDH